MTSIYWPGTQIVRSTNNAFDWNTGERSIFASLEVTAKQEAIAAARIVRRREQGDDTLSLHGVNKKADEILRTRSSAQVEGREAGQKAADKRDALRRGGR